MARDSRLKVMMREGRVDGGGGYGGTQGVVVVRDGVDWGRGVQTFFSNKARLGAKERGKIVNVSKELDIIVPLVADPSRANGKLSFFGWVRGGVIKGR